jgi:twitching motility protein PilT
VKRFNDVVLAAVKEGFSDIHIVGGQPLIVRKHGSIHFEPSITFSHHEVDALVEDILDERKMQMLKTRWSVDFAMTVNNVRIRVNVFNTIRGLSLAVRLLSGTVPTISRLNLHPSLQEICQLKSGLVLICGATGCGKSTTIAAIVNELNMTRSAHIITLEDPIEFRFPSAKSFIEQRELGTHLPSFEQGLLDVLREDPDVIVVGELREPETIRLTLNAAEAGHLVIATLHATNAEDAIYRVINSSTLDVQEQIRFQLASTIGWIIVQQLLYLERIRFRVPLLSILRGVQSIKGIIRENKLPQIENALHTGKNEGMFTMERYMTEYLNTRGSFVHPSQVFKPSEEAVHEAVYISPIFETEGAGDAKPAKAPPLPDAATEVRKKTPEGKKGSQLLPGLDDAIQEGFEQQYVIDEDVNLEELIKQMGHLK